MKPKHLLAGYLASIFGRPTNSVPLNIIDHGDKDSPMEQTINGYNTAILSLPEGATRLAGNGERVNPSVNRKVMTQIADYSWWRAVERDALKAGAFS